MHLKPSQCIVTQPDVHTWKIQPTDRFFFVSYCTLPAQYLIHQGVVAIIGPMMSSDVKYTQPYFSGFHIPQFAPVATDPTFSFTPANFPYLVRMSPSDTVQCQALAGIIEHYNWSQFALLVSKDDYGMLTKEGFPEISFKTSSFSVSFESLNLF